MDKFEEMFKEIADKGPVLKQVMTENKDLEKTFSGFLSILSPLPIKVSIDRQATNKQLSVMIEFTDLPEIVNGWDKYNTRFSIVVREEFTQLGKVVRLYINSETNFTEYSNAECNGLVKARAIFIGKIWESEEYFKTMYRLIDWTNVDKLYEGKYRYE